MRLEGKVAIVTGAASGIGQATATRFAREGAKVVVADVDAEKGEATVKAIEDAKGIARFIRTDVSRSGDVDRLFAATADNFGGVDVVFNNAGIAVFKGVVDTTDEEWRRVLGVNLDGVFYGIRASVPYLRRRGGGSIIITSSVHAVATGTGIAAYAASKGAVLALTRAAALDLAPFNIRVNCILPGAVDTPLHWANLAAVGDPKEEARKVRAAEPVGRQGRPDEIASAALFLASEESSFATGAPFVIDGGLLAKIM
jgi:NAD(P)-dependent dehydrogenase (short-subunit alcohol dehydrogenase family)